MADKERLEQEIAYYSALIQKFDTKEKPPSSVFTRPHSYYETQRRLGSNKYTYIRDKHNPPSTSTSSDKHSLGRQPYLVGSKDPVACAKNASVSSKTNKSSSRTVLLSGKVARRTVPMRNDVASEVELSTPAPTRTVLHCSNTQRSGSRRTASPHSPAASRQVVPLLSPAGSRQAVPPHSPAASRQVISLLSPAGSRQAVSLHSPVGSRQAVPFHSPATSRRVVTNKYQAADNKFVWVNKNVEKKKLKVDINPSTHKPVQRSDRVVTRHSITKVMRISTPKAQGQKLSSPPIHSLKALGIYKLISKDSPASRDKSLMTRNRLSPLDARLIRKYSFHRVGKFSPYLSKSGKRFISRYKIRRRPTESSAAQGASPALKKTKKRFSQYKIDRRMNATVHSRFKIDRVRAQRKPVKLIRRSIKVDRKAYRWVKHELRDANRSPYVSPFKLCRCSTITPESKIGKTLDRSWVVRKLASRSLQRSAVRSARAKYQKNNTNSKHCLFYMRFGKCKRGDNCYYTHDSDRIAVCTRYLRGTCTIDGCLFSHEPKKEKVPVCQHFLRGCCVRDGCPYLHVNVGRNAPICQSFAEFRYCHLGERCKKMHTDICPNRDSKGSCPKGSKCRLRHPVRILKISDKDRREGQSSCDASKMTSVQAELVVVHSGEKLTDALPAFISLNTTESGGSREMLLGKTKKLKNKPNFL